MKSTSFLQSAGEIEESAFLSFAPFVTKEMYCAEFWLGDQSDSEKRILSKQEITRLNHRMLYEGNLKLNPIWDMRRKKTGAIYEKNILRYAICVKRADIRSRPGSDSTPARTEAEMLEQLTVARVNTPAVIDQQSSDGSFYHVILYDYEGWAKSECFAICDNWEEWIRAQKMDQFLVVTVPRFRLEDSGKLLTMGTRIRLVSLDEYRSRSIALTAARSVWGCYVVEIPCRRTNGTYTVCYETISVERVQSRQLFSIGYLPYTKKTELELAFRFLGNRYGWGGLLCSVDCTQLVQEIFACFGLFLPRNSKEQSQIPADCIRLLKSSKEQKMHLLQETQTGALLYFPGHIMIYLGSEGEEYYVLSAIGTACGPKEDDEVNQIQSVLINTLSMRRRNKKTWMGELDSIIRWGI